MFSERLFLKGCLKSGLCDKEFFTKRQNFRLVQLKAFADAKIHVTEKLKFVSERIENILGKGEKAGYQHFVLFPKCFQKPP